MNKVVRNPRIGKYQFGPNDAALGADITFISKDSMHYPAMPIVQVDSIGIQQTDDTVYAQNLFVRFGGITDDSKIKIGIKGK